MKEQTEIFKKVKELITEVIGAEFIEEYTVEMESTLTGDLEMESIEIVELSEKIKKHYGGAVSFSEWMAKLSLEQLINLSIKDIVTYIEGCLQLK
ncbi:MAG: acyl carrier protein [Bacteroidales bacterium]|nr:acyl carrier protein [Bacteroidales bacterium]